MEFGLMSILDSRAGTACTRLYMVHCVTAYIPTLPTYLVLITLPPSAFSSAKTAGPHQKLAVAETSPCRSLIGACLPLPGSHPAFLRVSRCWTAASPPSCSQPSALSWLTNPSLLGASIFGWLLTSSLFFSLTCTPAPRHTDCTCTCIRTLPTLIPKHATRPCDAPYRPMYFDRGP